MLRDRLKERGKNDKSRRIVTSQKRRAPQSVKDEDKIRTQGGTHYQTAYRSSSQLEPQLFYIPNALRTPKECRHLQQALKGMQDWQTHYLDTGVREVDVLRSTDRFYFLLRAISVALNFDRSDQSMCGRATRALREAILAFQNCLGPMCTPVAVLGSIQLILRIACHRGPDKWYGLTSKFILQAITETLPELHPTGLLSKALLFKTCTAEELGTIYEVGSTLLQQRYGKWASTNFRLDFVSAALDYFPDASFNSVVTYAGLPLGI